MDKTIAARRVQHVSLVRPHGSDADARRFYGDLLGFEELPVPSSLAHLDLIWYRIGDDELHLLGRDMMPGDAGQHLCIEVDDVAVLRERLLEAGLAIGNDPDITNRPRFFCSDPFGNRIEFTTILGPYTE